MSDIPVEGTLARPLRLDPFQRIIEVHFGGGIGVLTFDAPEGVQITFEPVGSSSMVAKHLGDVIERKDFAKFDDDTGSNHPAPVSLLIADPMILQTLYGEGDTHWQVGILMPSPGPDPGFHNSPSNFPPFDFTPPANTFPDPRWTEYSGIYRHEKAAFLEHPDTRWIEVPDLSALGDDTLTTGLTIQSPFGPGDNWQELHYGEDQSYFYKLVLREPPQFTFLGAPVFDTIQELGPLMKGNIGYALQFNLFEPRAPAPWGLGEVLVNGNPGRKAVRHIYFLDFQVIKDGVVTVRGPGGRADDHLPSGYNMVFVFQLFGGSTKFTVRALQVESSAPASYNQSKTFPYTQEGELLKINRAGFV